MAENLLAMKVLDRRIEKLNEKIQNALENENYESLAQLRDDRKHDWYLQFKMLDYYGNLQKNVDVLVSKLPEYGLMYVPSKAS